MARYKYCETTGELIKQLLEWPLNTSLVVDVAPIIDKYEEPAGDYQWHYIRCVKPTQNELDKLDQQMLCESTYTILVIDKHVQGC